MVTAAVVLCLLAALLVRGGRTSPAESERLARAFLARLPERPLLSHARDLPFRDFLDRQREISEQRQFQGVERGLGLDRELAWAIRRYWGANKPMPTLVGDTALVRTAFSTYNSELESRYSAFVEVMLHRIGQDPRDTAARGVLALSVLLHLYDSDRGNNFSYPRAALLDRVLVGGTPLPVPDCPLFRADSTEPLDTAHCEGDAASEARRASRARVHDLAVGWLDEIEAMAPDSTWLRVGRQVGQEIPDEGTVWDFHPAFTTEAPPRRYTPSVDVTPTRVRVRDTGEVELWDSQVLDIDYIDLYTALRRLAHKHCMPLRDLLRRSFVPSHRHTLSRQPSERGLSLYFDRDMPFDTVKTVLRAAAVAGWDRDGLQIDAVTTWEDDRHALHTFYEGAVAVHPGVCDSRRSPPHLWTLFVQVQSEGLVVNESLTGPRTPCDAYFFSERKLSASSRPLPDTRQTWLPCSRPTCEDTDDWDYASLAVLASERKRDCPECEAILVAAEPDVPWQVMVRVLEATRAEVDGTELFPEPYLGWPDVPRGR